jgi:hypothetical protein
MVVYVDPLGTLLVVFCQQIDECRFSSLFYTDENTAHGSLIRFGWCLKARRVYSRTDL